MDKFSLKTDYYTYFLFFLLFPILGFSQSIKTTLESKNQQIQVFDTLQQSQVLVLGTHHFDESVLKPENQYSLFKLNTLLAMFKPTKVVVEWVPKDFELANSNYHKFLNDSTLIKDRYNEVFQIGFRLSKMMGHDSIYLFDDKTEYIGSLKDFTFEGFATYAETNDKGFYDKYEKEINEKFTFNQQLLKNQDLATEIILRNSPRAQKFNAERMHSYEVRAGIQKEWLGPDWLGRWYRRNVRMAANVLKINKPNDRILIIVGDNHKWTLDQLFEDMPDFRLISSWNFLIQNWEKY